MVDIQIYNQGSLQFILTPEKIIIITPLKQQFYLEPKMPYWKRRLKLIRTMIILNEVRSLNELASFTNPGINWVTTREDYCLDELVNVK